jgi:hypothetical protein
MIWKGKGVIQMEKGEPCMRSCWECNSAHEGLKKVNMLHWCFECGKYWIFDKFLKELKKDDEFDKFFRSKGMKEGDSTSKIDAGYRVMVLTIERRKKNDRNKGKGKKK